jgi:hypothetical protein
VKKTELTRRVAFKKDGLSRGHLWSYWIKYSDGTQRVTFGFKSKRAAIRDYQKQKAANFL